VCICLFWVCVVRCLGRGLATSWSLVQAVLSSVKRSWNGKQRPGLRRAVEPVKKQNCIIQTVRQSQSFDVRDINLHLDAKISNYHDIIILINIKVWTLRSVPLFYMLTLPT
jgi:hypothetical protein